MNNEVAKGSNDKRFPLQRTKQDEACGMPADVSYAFVERYAKVLAVNHGLSVRRLAERGGLAIEELYGAVNGWDMVRMLNGPYPAVETLVAWALTVANGNDPEEDSHNSGAWALTVANGNDPDEDSPILRGEEPESIQTDEPVKAPVQPFFYCQRGNRRG